MAEEPTADNKEFKVFDINDVSLETLYVNTTNAIVGEGEITLYFGFQPIVSNQIPACNPLRMTMTHDSFMRMMEYWLSRYRLLETLYAGKPVTLHDADPKDVKAAFDIMFGRNDEEAEQDGTETVSADKADPTIPASEE